MRTFHLGVDLIAGFRIGDHAPAEQGKDAAPDAEAHAIIGVLHDQQDGDVVRPARQDHGFGKVKRVGDQPSPGNAESRMGTLTSVSIRGAARKRISDEPSG